MNKAIKRPDYIISNVVTCAKVLTIFHASEAFYTIKWNKISSFLTTFQGFTENIITRGCFFCYLQEPESKVPRIPVKILNTASRSFFNIQLLSTYIFHAAFEQARRLVKKAGACVSFN